MDVTPTGAYTYSVHIECPAGIIQYQPSINLTYNSFAGSGLLGRGFSLSGLSSITRGMKTRFHDGSPQGKTCRENDAYLLDGKRLILISGEEGEVDSEYRITGDPFTIVSIKGISPHAVYWVIKTPNGETIEYGKEGNSCIWAISKSRNYVDSWYVSRRTDIYGNDIYYQYYQDDLTLYPKEIRYGGNRRASTPYQSKIEFEYDTLSTPEQLFIRGTQKGSISHRLKRITSSSGGNIFRKYELSYNTVSGFGSFLSEIKVSNSKGESYRPIEITWDVTQTGIKTQQCLADASMQPTYNIVDPENVCFTSCDFDGDGKWEVVRCTRSNANNERYRLQIFESQTSSSSILQFSKTKELTTYLKDINEQLAGPTVGDFDGDGRHDLLLIYNQRNGNNFRGMMLRSGSQTLKAHNLGFLKSGGSTPVYTLADTDHDGHDEIWVIDKVGTNNKYRLSSTFYIASADTFHIRHSLYLDLGEEPSQLFAGDFDCDGITDLCVATSKSLVVLHNNGGAEPFVASEKKTIFSTINAKQFKTGDFNGDGQFDFVCHYRDDNKERDCLALLINRGNLVFEKTSTIDILPSGTGYADHECEGASIICTDYNNDTRTDLLLMYDIVYRKEYKKYAQWIKSKGETLENSYPVYQPDYVTNKDLVFGCFDERGTQEILFYGNCLTAQSNTLEWLGYIPGNSNPSFAKIVRVKDSFGNVTEIEYDTTLGARASEVPDISSDYAVKVGESIPVVSQTISEDGILGKKKTVYRYGDFLFNNRGGGLAGCTYFEEENVTIRVKKKTTYSDFGPQLIPLQVTRTIESGNETATTETNYRASKYNNTTYQIEEYRSTRTDYDGKKTDREQNYDGTNGQITSVKTIYPDSESYDLDEYKDYAQYGTKWLPGTLIHTFHTKGAEDYTDITKQTYDATTGRLTTKKTHWGTDMELEHKYEADVFGNTVSVKTDPSGEYPVVETIGYDATGRFITSKISGGGLYVDSMECDIWGNIVRQTSNYSSSPCCTYKYDGWGKMTEVKSGAQTVSYKSEWEGSEGYKTTETTSGMSPNTSYFDKSGRVYKQTGKGPKGINVSEETEYDVKGRVKSKIQQYGGRAVTETFEYDDRDRTTSHTTSGCEKETFTYGANLVKSTKGDFSSTKYFDELGRTIRIEEPENAIFYTYGSNRELSKVSAGSNEIEIEYDAAGNRTLLLDSNAGETVYEYGRDGLLRSKTDARGIKTTYTYDDARRISVIKIDGEDSISHIYGDSGHGMIRLLGMSKGDMVLSYGYDDMGRTVRETRTTGNTPLTTYTTMDSYGRISGKTFPFGITVKYLYDSYGFVENVYMGNNRVWSLQSYDGKSSIFAIGGGTISQSVDNLGHTTGIELSINGNKTFSLYQSYKPDGNISSQSISGKGLPKRHLLFNYDLYDRLTSSLKDETKETINKTEYSSNGNIVEKESAGVYSYDTERPNAVSSVTDAEANRHLLPLKTDFNGFNKVSKVWRNSKSVYIEPKYGPDLEMWGSATKMLNTVLEATVSSPDYDFIFTKDGKTRRYYYIDDKVVIYKEDSKQPTILYAGRDHLSTVYTLVDSTEISYYTAMYDIWGKTMNITNDYGFPRGFGGHITWPIFNLINMGGRLYDPEIAQFLSPDNYVQLPDYSQSFNRYSYCLNNPLRYSDPSGQWFGLDDLIVAGAGLVAGYISHGISTHHWGLGALGAAVSGAVTGWVGYNLGGAAALGMSGAWNQAASIGVNTLANHLLPSMSDDVACFSFGVSPTFGWGMGSVSLGFSVNTSVHAGKFSFTIGTGGGTSPLAGSSYGGLSATARYGTWGAGYTRTMYYNQGDVPQPGDKPWNNVGSQTTGTITVFFPGGSFSLMNDLYGDRKDRWRTTAAELAIGKFSLGTYVETNDAAEIEDKKNEANKQKGEIVYTGEAPKPVKKHKDNTKGVWPEGEVYSAPIWVGYTNHGITTRIGFQHYQVQNLTQNLVHKYVKTNFFTGYKLTNHGYFYQGNSNPYNFWTY